MAWIDSLLGIVNERGADELRVAAGHEPQMFAGGVSRRLSIPKMSRRDVEDLLGELLSDERKARIAAGETVALVYHSRAHGAFQVTLTGESELSATFLKGKVPTANPETGPTQSSVGAAPPSAPANVPSAPEPPMGARPAEPREDGTVRAAIPLVIEAARQRASDLHLADGE